MFAFYYEHSYPVERKVVVVDTAEEHAPQALERKVKRVKLDVGKQFYTRAGAETYAPDALSWLKRNFGPIGGTLRLFVVNEDTGEAFEQMNSLFSMRKQP
ncbi:MAG: hypothetical protein ABSB70_12400 [Candidatus Velthaea sp.]|jgi:hypothetical protein